MAATSSLTLKIQNFGSSRELPFPEFDQVAYKLRVSQLKKEAFEDYKRNRENGNTYDSPKGFPTPSKENFQKFYLNRVGHEYLRADSGPYYHFKVIYFEDDDMREWMERKDRNYLQRMSKDLLNYQGILMDNPNHPIVMQVEGKQPMRLSVNPDAVLPPLPPLRSVPGTTRVEAAPVLPPPLLTLASPFEAAPVPLPPLLTPASPFEAAPVPLPPLLTPASPFGTAPVPLPTLTPPLGVVPTSAQFVSPSLNLAGTTHQSTVTTSCSFFQPAPSSLSTAEVKENTIKVIKQLLRPFSDSDKNNILEEVCSSLSSDMSLR